MATLTEAELLRQQVDGMAQEIHALERKLGELHATDINALRRAYRSLSQHVQALEDEASGMVEQLQQFETAVLPPELVARELGVAAAVAMGVHVLAQTSRVLPIKSPTVVAKGLWLLGGAVVLFRLSAGAVAHVGLMLNRNARRKRHLLKKLEVVQERVRIMSELQQWADKQLPPSASSASVGAGTGSASRTSPLPLGPEAGPEGEGVLVGAPSRGSPTASAASSEGELVEVPGPSEVAAAQPGACEPSPVRPPSSAAADAPAGRRQQQEQAGAQVDMAQLPDPALSAWSRYVRLGHNQ